MGRKLVITVSKSLESHDIRRGEYKAVMDDFQGFGASADKAVDALIVQAQKYGVPGNKNDFKVVEK